MSEHDRFDELAALAAGGMVAGSELQEWIEHSADCPQCQSAYQKFVDVHDQDLPLAAARRFRPAGPNATLPPDFRKQFLGRMRAQGWRFSDDAMAGKSDHLWNLSEMQIWRRFGKPAAVAVSCIAVFGAIVGGQKLIEAARNRSVQADAARSETMQVLSRENTRLTSQVQQLTLDDAAKEARIASLERDLALDKAAAENWRWKLEQAQTQKVQIEEAWHHYTAENDRQLQQTIQQLQSAQAELERAKTSNMQNDATMVALQTRVTELEQQVRTEIANGGKDREVLGNIHDIRDIMGSRNLHIVDVIDADVSGKRTRAFGRIFYTEGKSLVFYAFDLSEVRTHNSKYSFQVWGETASAGSAVKNLGLLFKDDNAQRRWILQVTDPAMLHQISKVFVTVEPYGGGKRPRGQKLLYAFLGMDANHP